jgi:acetyl esterase/lipase
MKRSFSMLPPKQPPSSMGQVARQGVVACSAHISTQAGAGQAGFSGRSLALLSGFRVTPRPTAIASFWGYGAADAPFDSEPSDFYRSTSPLVDRADALAAVGGDVLTATGPRMNGRWPYYLYLRQQGLWRAEVTGLDPLTQQGELDSFASVRNVDGDFPPTVLVHGTNDTDVPYEESADLAAELSRHGVVHEFVTVEGAGHGLSGVESDVLSDAIDQALAFIDEHLRGR